MVRAKIARRARAAWQPPTSSTRRDRANPGGTRLLDLTEYRARAWKSWQVFLYAFVVYLMGIVAIVLRGMLTEIGTGAVFVAALLAAIAVAGLGFQEAQEAGAFRRTPRRNLADDEW